MTDAIGDTGTRVLPEHRRPPKRCTARMQPIAGAAACRQPAVSVAGAGCVHEHVGWIWLCEQHQHIQRGNCGHCRDAGHRCEMMVGDAERMGS